MNLRDKTNIILIGYGMTAFAVAVLAIYPLVRRIEESSVLLLSREKELAFLEFKTERLQKAEQSYQALQVSGQLDTFFVDPEVDTGFIEFLETIANDVRVSIEISRRSLEKKQGDIWSPRGYMVSCVGPFQGILRFIEKLETAPYVIELSNLTIEKGKETGIAGEEIFDAAFSIKTYAKK